MIFRKSGKCRIKRRLSIAVLSLGFPILISCADDPLQTEAIFPQDQEACIAALKNQKTDPVIRRVAFRRLVYKPETMRQAIESGLKDIDPGIRRLALYELYQADGKKALPQFLKMADDESADVREMLYVIGGLMRERGETSELFQLIQQKKLASAANSKVFSFYRINSPISQSPTHDHQIELLKTIPLPIEGWAFRTDPEERGHLEKWFDVKLDDSQWKRITVNGSWEKQGYAGYDGIAWYRVKFRMPEKMQCQAVELSFGGVDETAWVWLNGQYIGQHDMGPDGWNIPFKLDVTAEIGWDKENLLVVRVGDTMSSGGIYKPVCVEVIK